eukprot:6206814-Pleurochrysis_carterae.AAC.2
MRVHAPPHSLPPLVDVTQAPVLASTGRRGSTIPHFCLYERIAPRETQCMHALSGSWAAQFTFTRRRVSLESVIETIEHKSEKARQLPLSESPRTTQVLRKSMPRRLPSVLSCTIVSWVA